MTENTTHSARKTTSKRSDLSDNPFDFPSSDAKALDCILLKNLKKKQKLSQNTKIMKKERKKERMNETLYGNHPLLRVMKDQIFNVNGVINA